LIGEELPWTENPGMFEHRALRAASGSGRIELKGDLIASDRQLWIACRECIAPCLVTFPFRHLTFHGDELFHARQFTGDAAHEVGEFSPDKKKFRFAVVDDV